MKGLWTNSKAGTFNAAIQRFLNHLGDEGERVLVMLAIEGSSLPQELAEFAKERALWHATAPHNRIFRTIKIGARFKTVGEYREALHKANILVDEYALPVFGDTVVGTDEQEIDLVAITPRQLGLTERSKFSDISSRAQGLGLELCPIEAGLLLRLEYQDQPSGGWDWLVIAMEPVASVGRPGCLMLIKHNNILQLSSTAGDVEGFYEPETNFVFKRRK